MATPARDCSFKPDRVQQAHGRRGLAEETLKNTGVSSVLRVMRTDGNVVDCEPLAVWLAVPLSAGSRGRKIRLDRLFLPRVGWPLRYGLGAVHLWRDFGLGSMYITIK